VKNRKNGVYLTMETPRESREDEERNIAFFKKRLLI